MKKEVLNTNYRTMETRNTNYESVKSDSLATKAIDQTKNSVIDALDPEKISSELMATFFWKESKEYKKFQEIQYQLDNH